MALNKVWCLYVVLFNGTGRTTSIGDTGVTGFQILLCLLPYLPSFPFVHHLFFPICSVFGLRLFWSSHPFVMLCLFSFDLQPVEEDWERDLAGEWDLSDCYRHSANGEIAGLQVRLHTDTVSQNMHAEILSWLMVVPQGLYEAGGSGWQKDWLYCESTGE